MPIGSLMRFGRRHVSIVGVCLIAVAGCAQHSADDLFTQGEHATHDVNTYDEAVEHLSAFLKHFPEDPRADVALQAVARVYQAQGKSGLAIKSYEELINRFPNSRYADQAQFMIGYIYDLSGNRDMAVQAYRKVIQ